MSEAFLHPKKLIIDGNHTVVINGVPIFKDVKAGIEDMNKARYEQAGMEFGAVAAMVLWGSNQQEMTFMQ